MSSHKKSCRPWQVAALVALAGTVGGCNDFLKVQNPGAIEAPKLNSPAYIALMVNGVIGEFQRSLGNVLYYSSLFGDEIRNHHVFFEERLIDLRQVAPENGTFAFFVYTPLQRARFMADSVAGRLKILLGDSAARDLRVARSQAYAGYTYVLLGENLCATPINLSKPYTPEEMFQFAIQRFDDAIAIAAAAKAAGASATAADSIRNVALVGAGRASLGRGDKAKAIAYATQVPAVFEFRAYYSENSAGQNNYYYARFSTGASGSNTASVSNTPFAGLKDPRVPTPDTTERMQDATRAFNPNSPSAFSSYSGTPTGADFTKSASIRVASALEAQYIIAEATGPAAATIAFIESRRLIAPANTEPTTAANFLTNLRDQRRRDFFLDGHRVGDLRRYKKLYGIDEFQRGAYPGSTTGEQYGPLECFPLPLSEINGNPNVPKTP